MTGAATASPAVPEIDITRVLDAPLERVWRAWTIPTEFARWFGSPPYTTPESTVEMDVRPGGRWRATQVSAYDGSELPFVGRYLEVVRPERLVLTFANPEDPEDPAVEVITVTFEDQDGTTVMRLRQEGHLPPEQSPLLEAGYGRFFDQLAAVLAEPER